MSAISERTPAASGVLLVSGCDVLLVPEQGEAVVLRARDILVADGRIEEVRPAGAPGAPKSAEVIDGRGLLAVPGLVDAHTHSPMTLMRGAAEDVTVEGWFNDRVWPMERWVAMGPTLGPTLVAGVPKVGVLGDVLRREHATFGHRDTTAPGADQPVRAVAAGVCRARTADVRQLPRSVGGPARRPADHSLAFFRRESLGHLPATAETLRAAQPTVQPTRDAAGGGSDDAGRGP
ncbi:hypothetical protein [Streptomyces sp. NPDC096132]|uniref:hypothetical protein n=1 Tax=Streptomyces sp. NPDC096132 TaxID=3366075 RepID=UPI00382E1159